MTLPKFLLTVVASVAGTVLLCGGLWLLLPGRGPERPAAPAVSLPAEVRGAPGEFVRVTAATTHPVSWDYPDAGLSVFPSEILKDDKTSVLAARTPGRYRLKAWVAVGGKAAGSNWCVVVIGDAPPVPPGPNPPPPPGPGPGPGPEPADVFYQSLKSAWAQEPAADRAKRADLVALYQMSAKTAADQKITTYKALFDVMRQARVSLMGEALPKLRAAVTQQLNRDLPTSAAAALDAAGRDLCAGTFNKVADYLGRLP